MMKVSTTHMKSTFTALKGLLVAVFVFMLWSFGHAEFYRWTDEKGTVHLSDSLPEGMDSKRNRVEKLNLDGRPSSPVVSPATPPTSQISPNASTSEPPAQEKKLKTYTVPYRPYGGSAKRVIVAAVLNGSVTAPLAIDTGAPGTLISASLAKKLGLFDGDQSQLLIVTGGIGGTTPAIRSIIKTIKVGGAKSEFVPIVIIDELSDSFEGLLGLDFVSNYNVSIDSKRKVVVFEELPGDMNHPGGHDQAWWTSQFKEFASYRNLWKGCSEDKKIRDSVLSGGTTADRKGFAERQFSEAEKLLTLLHQYAVENLVPMQWRQY